MAEERIELVHVDGIDYEFWTKMPGWTLREAAALLVGLDPDNTKESGDRHDNTDSLVADYEKLRRWLNRARKMDLLSDPIPPLELIQWAKSNKIEVSPKLYKEVKNWRHHKNWRLRYRKMKQERDELSAGQEDVIKSKERASFLKIILGVARVKFDHQAGSSSTVSKICTALDKADLSVGDDTVRRIIRQADDWFAK